MKKFLLFLFSALLMLPATAREFSYTYEGQTLVYTVLSEDDMTVSVKSPSTEISGAVKIPSSIKTSRTQNYRVTQIENEAFSECSEITSVVIPESVTNIDRRAFSNCWELKSVSITESVTYIGEDAFEFCGLTSFTIPKYLSKISAGMFSNCPHLQSIVIPETVKSIGEGAFAWCSMLTSVIIPSSVTTIEKFAFSSCGNLTSVDLPETITEIGEYAFSDCHNIVSVNIPKSLSIINAYMFDGCWSLRSIEIPGSITSIGNDAFNECKSLTKVVIPNSVLEIGMSAFFECENLNTLYIGNSVNNLSWAFNSCNNLREVYYSSIRPLESTKYEFSDEAYKNAVLYVPEEAVERCKEIDPWKNFRNIQAYDFNAGIEAVSVELDENAPCEVYSLTGVKVADSTSGLTPGVYLVRQNGKVNKIFIQ